jgi:SAM-dependent methyltransferase
MSEQDDWAETNRAMWDERVPIHVGSDFYDVDGFLAGATTLRPFELEELGDVDGRTLVHPQCHFGLDTLSWARRGARVTGLDFSGPAVEAARDVAARAGLEAGFVQADVHDAVQALGGRRFDVVYTGLGAINWLPDIERWAQVMVELLEPGGTFYLAEFHPFSWVFGDDDRTVDASYFSDGPVLFDDPPGSYADLNAPTQHNRSIEWNHGLGETVSALISAGLRIELLHEHDYTLFPRWPDLQVSGRHFYRLPEGEPSLPLMYSLRATRPKWPEG